jgi:hypothetical protein
MADKFRNKYRIQSNRMPGWDYSKNGIYFITLVVQNRECILGDIVDGKMILSDFGHIVENEWLKSFEMRGELFLDEYIIMPNHLHAIVILDKNETEINKLDGLHGLNGLDGLHGWHELHGSHVDARPCVYYNPRNNPRNNPQNQSRNHPILSENQNQFHHLLPVLNHPSIRKLMILSMKTIWIFQNTIVTIIFFNPIITIILSEIIQNTTE